MDKKSNLSPIAVARKVLRDAELAVKTARDHLNHAREALTAAQRATDEANHVARVAFQALQDLERAAKVEASVAEKIEVLRAKHRPKR